jgi:lysophospholipase L1-like esterase
MGVSMKKKLLTALTTTTLIGALFSSAVLADSKSNEDHQKSLVALGDSISYGYNLGPSNDQPSSYAFPFIIGNDRHYNVRDLALPGLTSGDLLASLNSPQLKEFMKHADVITLDIGSNDILDLASPLIKKTMAGIPITPDEYALLQSQAQQTTINFSKNLPLILKQIRETNHHAQIILYNLYNPFPQLPVGAPNADQMNFLHQLGENLLTPMNMIIQNASSDKKLDLANANTAFNQHQSEYVRLAQGDVHPTIEGQEVLAHIGELVLKHEDEGEK